MKTANKSRTIQWINNEYQKGNISFKHKLQRPIGQWSPKMKSLLIHSLLAGFPVNTIYTVEEDGVIYTLDGSQRTSICIAYINDEFALSKDTPCVTIKSKKNGEAVINEHELARKKFKKLDKEVQETLLACTLEFCTISDYTDNEIREMFRRQNTSKPLTGKLLRACESSDKFSDAVYSLATHPFMDKILTPTQRKNGTDRDLIIQAIMLASTNKDNDFTSFRNNDMNVFVKDYGDSNIDKFKILKETLDKFNNSFEDIKIPLTSISMILYSGYKVIKDKKSVNKLVEKINDFVKNYDTNEEYKSFVVSGTSGKESVNQRLNYWKKIIKDL